MQRLVRLVLRRVRLLPPFVGSKKEPRRVLAPVGETAVPKFRPSALRAFINFVFAFFSSGVLFLGQAFGLGQPSFPTPPFFPYGTGIKL